MKRTDRELLFDRLIGSLPTITTTDTEPIGPPPSARRLRLKGGNMIIGTWVMVVSGGTFAYSRLTPVIPKRGFFFQVRLVQPNK